MLKNLSCGAGGSHERRHWSLVPTAVDRLLRHTQGVALEIRGPTTRPTTAENTTSNFINSRESYRVGY